MNKTINIKDKYIYFDKKFLKNFEIVFSLFFNYKNSFLLEKNYNFLIKKSDYKKIKKLTKLYIKNKDITHLLKTKSFYNLKLDLSKNVFYPQFDTEGLVEICLYFNKKENFYNGFEFGVGTGAISLSIIKNSKIKMFSIDINRKAIKLSIKNLIKNDLNRDQITLQKSNLKKIKLENKYSFLISNPPYIKKRDKNISKWVKKHQPKKSLYAKNNGLFYYDYLITNYFLFLKQKGYMFFEIGFNQKESIEKIIKKNILNIDFYDFKKDINNNWRYLVIKFNK